jgi:hypothetical protein
MCKNISIRIIAVFTAVFRSIGLCQYVTAAVKNFSPDHPVCHRIKSGIVWALYNIPAG